MNTTNTTTISPPSSGTPNIYGATEQYHASSRFEAEDEDVATVYGNGLQHSHYHRSQTTQPSQNYYFPSPPYTPPEDSQDLHLQSYLHCKPRVHTPFHHLPLPPSPPPMNFESDDLFLPSDDRKNSKEIFSMEELNTIFESLAAAVSACGGSDADDDLLYDDKSYVGGNRDCINDDDICCLVLDDDDTAKLEAALSSMTMTT